ncbi:MAG: lipid-binding SYLF domain-containing protein [Bacteroidota bacterium]|jgi:SH3 domain-containing YSC84-like protein 1|nr:lipid-binding SYLF domain-containing protein [Bacteroidota bacterium]
MKISRIITLILSSLFLCAIANPVKSQNKQEDKIVAATQVLQDFSKMKESIPEDLLKITQGIIVVPKLINAGFVLAGKRGKGIAMVKLADGSWSNPVFVTLTGGSVGFQVGVESIDLVLIFKDSETLNDIGKGSFTLGGDISVTAGPVGRNSSASTDYKMEAEVYSYSRSKGLFAGISLSGSAIAIDAKANESFYGNDDDAKTLFSDDSQNNSASVEKMKSTLQDMYQ